MNKQRVTMCEFFGGPLDGERRPMTEPFTEGVDLIIWDTRPTPEDRLEAMFRSLEAPPVEAPRYAYRFTYDPKTDHINRLIWRGEHI